MTLSTKPRSLKRAKTSGFRIQKGLPRMSRLSNVPPMENAKRLAILGLACVLSVWLATVLLGCESSDMKKAQECLQAGADQIQKIRNQATEWQNQLISTSGATDPGTLKNGVAEVKLSAKGMSNTVDSAKAEYKNITRLNGVGDYVKYADLRLAQLDMIQNMLNKTNEYLENRVDVVNSGDLSGVAAIEQQYSNEISGISDKIQKIDDEAAKMKKDKKL